MDLPFFDAPKPLPLSKKQPPLNDGRWPMPSTKVARSTELLASKQSGPLRFGGAWGQKERKLRRKACREMNYKVSWVDMGKANSGS